MNSIKKILIANRGAIAVRIIRTLREMNIKSVAVYSSEDCDSLHVSMADESVCLGDGAAKDTYLNQNKIFSAVEDLQVQAIHPGYGFLSENADFVKRCEKQGIIFLGPTAKQIELFGLKHTARDLAEKSGIPLLTGTGLLDDLSQAKQAAKDITYPVILKSTAGGGGIGMQICKNEAELADCFESVKRMGENNFSNAGVFLEKFIERARHIEVQVFGDGYGDVIALGERDCSSQRRNQKVIEEAPAPNLPEKTRTALHEAAKLLSATVNYRSAGTVEFIVDQQSNQFYFLEVNTRLQVEHGVTEEIFNIDIVRCMIELGDGTLSELSALFCCKPSGHAIQLRLYAEDAQKDFKPCAGLLTQVEFPEVSSKQDAIPGLRIDHWIEAGVEVSAFFDPMLAKIIVHADNRETAINNLQKALKATHIYGIETNCDYVAGVLDSPEFYKGEIFTRFLNEFSFKANTFDVISGGTFTTIQDFPGRQGYWDVGVPPSGPFDSQAFRLANVLLGNPESAAALEITLNGPLLRFNCETRFVLSGAPMDATLDGVPIEFWKTYAVHQGQQLRIGKVIGKGARAYLAIQGGIACPDYLGSKSTFTLGQFGGHAGRTLHAGDVLHLQTPQAIALNTQNISPPDYPSLWELHVIYGPHGAPDFFTNEDMENFFNHTWEVHYNSSRTGVRLIGPKPQWARSDGGEAGMHPSNIHDNAYAIGSIDFTGDMPVILGPDGPSLGGFVCPATVIQADLWKLGQLKAGDKLRFISVSIEDAVSASAKQNQAIAQKTFTAPALEGFMPESTVIERISAITDNDVDICFRASGDNYLLVEFGDMQLDIELRFRAHALMLWLFEHALEGIQELTPGIRSLQVHYNPLQIPLRDLLSHLREGLQQQKDIASMEVPARVVYLPLSWDDEACQLAIEKYMQSVRKDAPWCPSNIEFIRRINGLDSLDEVKRIVFEASYLVMGLGDVYLGAPVATPMDPRHRLVTTKYNPARTWTAENSVGIGGSYLCVYGMEGPGGYQFVGRTLQMWNRYRETEEFDKPWLLDFFDQIRFYPVTHEELLDIRQKFPKGQYPLKIEKTRFSLAKYRTFLQENAEDIENFTEKRKSAFDQELARWIESGQMNFSVDQHEETSEDETTLSEYQVAVESNVSGNVWELKVKTGDFIKEGDVLMVIESMKMEIPVYALDSGELVRVLREPGQSVKSGQVLMVIDTKDRPDIKSKTL